MHTFIDYTVYMFTFTLMKSAADISAPTARFLLDLSLVLPSICIFILTILVPFPDSFVLLFFSAVTVEFPFRFIKVYLISSHTLHEVSEEKTLFFFFPPVCDLSEPTVYTYSRSNDNHEQRFGMFPTFFFLFFSLCNT